MESIAALAVPFPPWRVHQVVAETNLADQPKPCSSSKVVPRRAHVLLGKLCYFIQKLLVGAEAAETRLGPLTPRWSSACSSTMRPPMTRRRRPTSSTPSTSSSRPRNMVLQFIAGHRVNDGADYRFLATNGERTSTGALRGSTVMPWQTLQGSVEATKGRWALFLDTCHSGNAYSAKRRLRLLARELVSR